MVAIPAHTREELVCSEASYAETPAVRAGAIRGAFTGIVLGLALWGVIITTLVSIFK